ncbi:hypothetical protein [Xanthomonas arboricola]|uniref:Uncharacterized protein n=1 Tax=Xanthomonas arboricola pv. guizotiae TaxID=487867 RepID=A0A2S7A4N9_9XANT|nr:hypothetical protein [Xanthomonas arboricola]PPU01728.1 hypothetical protein XarbCFBP7409_06955 [Xanthomonas arboricola pv. guizotiae]PPU23789.1 hypothetical protein XarbCFBP7408_10480 [Xanthomonas arboricola pv. guizotiae]
MKSWIGMLMLAGCFAGQATAQTKGVTLVCRMNDPFLFCSDGCADPDHHWAPLDPIQATIEPVAPYCPFPTTADTNYCKGWSQRAFTAYFQYVSVCPKANKTGEWTGKKPADMVPFKH